MAERLGEILIKKKLITPEQLENALQDQVHTGEFLGETLVRLNYLKEEEMLQILAEQFNTRFVNLNDIRVNPMVVKLVPKALVWEQKVLPIDMRSGILLVAMHNPLDIWPLSVLEEKLNLDEVQFVLAKKSEIIVKIRQFYGDAASE